MYFVFRRNDGFVGAITAQTAEIGRQRLAGYVMRSGERVDYEILLETEVWEEAHLLLIAQRTRCATVMCENARADDHGELCEPCWTSLYGVTTTTGSV